MVSLYVFIWEVCRHIDLFCRILLCLTIYSAMTSSIYLLLFFEPSSIAFETLQVMLLFLLDQNKHVMENEFELTVCKFFIQAIVVHGFQLLDIWMHHSAGDAANCRLSKIFNMSSAGDFANKHSFFFHEPE